MCADVPVFRVIYGIHLPKIDSKSPCYLSPRCVKNGIIISRVHFFGCLTVLCTMKPLIFFPLKNSECQVTDTIVHYQLTNTYLQQMKSQKYLHNLFLNEFFDVAHAKLLTLHQMTEMSLRRRTNLQR